jgi:Tol biopolymer transport system component
MRRLVVLAVIGGCGRLSFSPILGHDGALGDAPDACMAFGAWNAPQLIPGMSSTLPDQGPSVSADGLTLYFDSQRSGINHLYVTRRADRASAFGAPSEITELDNAQGEFNATTTADEREIFFDSKITGVYCLYTATRADAQSKWGAPSRLDQTCATTESAGPSVSPDGLTLYYVTHSSGTFEGTLVVTTRAQRTDAFAAGAPIAELDAGQPKGYPAISPDGLTMYFESGSPLDLWVTSRPRVGQPFATPQRIVELDTSSSDADPGVSADGQELFFTSDRLGGVGDYDLYVTTRSCL